MCTSAELSQYVKAIRSDSAVAPQWKPNVSLLFKRKIVHCVYRDPEMLFDSNREQEKQEEEKEICKEEKERSERDLS